MKVKALSFWGVLKLSLRIAWEDRAVIGCRWPQALWLCIRFATGFRVRIEPRLFSCIGYIDFLDMSAARRDGRKPV